MTDSASQTARQQQVQEKTLFGKILSLPFAFLGVIFGSIFLSIVVEWVGLACFWPEEGWHHAQEMLKSEIGWVDSSFTRSAIVQEPGRTALRMSELAYEYLFERSGAMTVINDLSREARGNAQHGHGVQQAAGVVYSYVEDYAMAAVYTILTFVVRVVVLILALPQLILAVLVGMVDGLVRRDQRRFSAGRESSFIYHRARMFIMPMLVAPWLIYLSMPFSVNPMLVLMPCAVALGLAVSITTGSFKKYL